MSSPSIDLLPGYRADFQALDSRAWFEIAQQFDDASIYQTWPYGEATAGSKRSAHMVLRLQDHVVAAAQVRIVETPIPGAGAAYVRWGPMWRRRDASSSVEALEMALRALRAEYVLRRGLVLRLLPLMYSDETSTSVSSFEREGFQLVSMERPQRTLLVDLDAPLAAIRSRFAQKWRNCLNRAERNGLDVVEGTDDALFGRFIGMYREMHERKKFLETSSIEQFRVVQQGLIESQRMRILLASSNGTPAAGMVISCIGKTGLYLFGCTTNAGMTTNASYLLQWTAIGWLKSQGATIYNLHGINPETNPGSYRFKAGIAGRTGRDVHYLGTFDAFETNLAHTVIRAAGSARAIYRRSRSALGMFRNSGGARGLRKTPT